MLTVVDDCTRECPAIEVDTSLGGLRVRRVLDRIASERGLPEAIVLDNGPEFRGRALAAWSEERARAAGIHPARQAGAECLRRELQRPAARRMPECELVHQSERRTTKDRNLAAGLQRATSAQFVELFAARRVCTDEQRRCGHEKASTGLPEQGTQTPSPAPDLIPAETQKSTRELTSGLVQQTGALHWGVQSAP